MTGTFDHEDALPRVPLPRVGDSCRAFLEWCEPLLTREELDATRRAVAEFVVPGGDGDALHARLEEYAARPGVHSWLDDFWRRRYLGRRDRIAINANFMFLFAEPDPAHVTTLGGPHPRQAQLDRAAALVSGALAHKVAVDTGTFPPTVQRGRPLSMVQHRHLFGTARIPGPEIDDVRTPYSAATPGPAPARHVLVIRRGHLVRLEVLGADGAPHTPADIAAALREIADATAGPGPGVGALTSLPREDWARLRTRLRAVGANAALLEEVETALFAICLDDATPGTDHDVGRELLVGDAANRWFDLAVSFVVFPDGRSGLNGEHCLLDGTTIAEMCDAVLGPTAAEHARAAGARPQGMPRWREIDLELDADLHKAVAAAREEYHAAGRSTSTRLSTYVGLGSADAKSFGVSPDGLFQMAFQLANARVTGAAGTTYESISTRHFHHGRTEAMRVVTPQVRAFVGAMADGGRSPAERLAALRTAIDAHVERARACQAGAAPEQHLWQLAMLATGPPPALFASPGWRVLREDSLSTSAVAGQFVTIIGFGATSGQCVGVAYSPRPDRLVVFLAAPVALADRVAAFERELGRALSELGTLLTEGRDSDAQ